ncbi:MAG: Hsp20/alpha crystallin family protein [Candidatus Pacebacteria bacterium]|nr:Hsp20/alpha crystallin family protein [Candidatus Paceibacterota bacterium]
MAIVKWEPFGEFDRFFSDLPALGASHMGMGDMAVDMYEDGNNLVAEMSVPGIEADKIDVSVEGNYLRICGRREEEKEKKTKQFYSKEIHRGSFERALRLPSAVNETKVSAEYKDGLLKIILPKLEEKKAGKVKVMVKK